MKKLTLLLTIITFTVSAPVYAQEIENKHIATDTEHVSTTEAGVSVSPGDAHVSVNGLVCDFCARALEKVFGKEETVKAIDVNLDTKVITINFNEGQTLSDERIRALITDSGYNVEDIHRVE